MYLKVFLYSHSPYPLHGCIDRGCTDHRCIDPLQVAVFILTRPHEEDSVLTAHAHAVACAKWRLFELSSGNSSE